jgi:spermidine/putrescine ABC transporter ATP-binding subunit
MARLEIENVEVSLGGSAILKGVSLDVAEGECVALLGPSGCGKTTMLRAIAGFVSVDSGDIRLGEHSVLELPPHRRNVGFVFQDYALFPHMTVAENVAYGLKMRRVTKADAARRVDEILALVQLTGMDERFPAHMSGGQRQRVALARALVIHPEALLLDEPLGALDRKLRDQMQVEFKRIQRETGVTTIFVTHDQEEALSLSDRVAVMFEGEISEIGAPSSLYRTPGSQAVMDFLGASNILAGVAGVARGKGTVVVCEGGLEIVMARSDIAEGRSLRLGIRPERISLAVVATAGTDNAIPGVVEERVYKGPHAELYVRTAEGNIIAVHVSEGKDTDATPVDVGASVYLVFEASDVLVFE